MQKALNRLAFSLAACLFISCQKEEVAMYRTSNFDEFVQQYNGYVKQWLVSQISETQSQIKAIEEERLTADLGRQANLSQQLKTLERERQKLSYRQDRGDYFQYKQESDLPQELAWEDGMEHEEIGDPRAKKGGMFRQFMLSFPPTIRPFGANSNNGFRGVLYDGIDMPLVGLHPKSMAMIPGLAKRWAITENGRTVFFELDPEARYSDGIFVSTEDFIFGVYIRISDNLINPFAKQYFLENIAGVTVYGGRYLSISLPEAQLYSPVICGGLSPSPPHFYKDYGPDYTERYQWKFPPTTGAYEVLPKDIVKGVSITQTRVKNWWARDRKYYQYRFNPDYIVHTVVRDESKAFELFRAGQLDMASLTRPEYWYEKSQIQPVFDGYIERYTFYTQYPDLPRGLYLNTSKPLLDDKTVRIGIHHAIHWQKVIDVIFRGDYSRLNAFNQGYLLFSDTRIKAREYSIQKAREEFHKAGFTKTNRRGILQREDGTLLSVSVSYPAMPILDKIFAILREEAKACGLDLRLDPGEATVNYKKIMLKQHEIAFSAWMITPPIPAFHQFIHSTNARDEKGNIKPQTNNLFVWGREDTDLLSDRSQFAQSEEELREISFELQRIIHDEALFVPSYTVNFLRVGSWRWVRWPDSEQTRFSSPVVYDPTETHSHWIDDEMKEETLLAMREGKTLEEVNRVMDDYRYPNVSSEKLDKEDTLHE